MRKLNQTLALLALLAAAAAAPAQTVVKEAWVRGTVPQQKASGLFAQITSSRGGKLVAATSPVAGVVEIHEMKMDGDVMRMKAVAVVDLPAGRTVELKPGGHHVMLMELKQELKAGEVVPVTLVVEGADGRRETIEVKAAVKALADGSGHGQGHDAKKH